MNYKLSEHINKEAVFLVNWSELEGRLEPEYYTPELRELENRIREKSSKKLRDYIINIAGGATPSTTKQDKYYTDEENGFPFLRVQNLQTNGEINLDNLKFINEKTHEGMLKRSQVEEGDLLVKITGVGRMAIASVAPKGFVGNTNQHMVVIKTGDRNVSEYLAKYLNLDLVEKLATRRATGATRPALDYSALKSIPIIEGIDFSILEKAEETKKRKEAESEKLFRSINHFIHSELGIKIPEEDKSLKNRVFKTSFNYLTGTRFDPSFFFYDKISFSNKYPVKRMKELVFIKKGQSITSSSIEEGPYPVIAGGQSSPYSHSEYNYEGNVITVSASGAYSGYVWYHEGPIFASDCSVIFSRNEKKLNTEFLYWVLKSIQNEIYKLQQGAAQPHVYPEDLRKIEMPLPSIEEQNKILTEVKNRKNISEKLHLDAQKEIEIARNKIEELILS